VPRAYRSGRSGRTYRLAAQPPYDLLDALRSVRTVPRVTNYTLHATDAEGRTVPAKAALADVYAGRAKSSAYTITLTQESK
jgi:hypothetical protein